MKPVKRFISVLLCIAILFGATSCTVAQGIMKGIDYIVEEMDIDILPDHQGVEPGDHTGNKIVPEGYTGGFVYDLAFHSVYGIYWLETYEEVLEAVELLKANGSIVEPRIGVEFGEEQFDVKWAFVYQRKYAEPKEEGKNFFDRRIDNGDFKCYIFRTNVTIERLIYNTVFSYKAVQITTKNFVKVEDAEELHISWFRKDDYFFDQPYRSDPYEIVYNDMTLAEIDVKTFNDDHRKLEDDFLNLIMNSLVFVE